MIQRNEVNKLVVHSLNTNNYPMRASEIYQSLKTNHPNVLTKERVTCFRSFVRLMPTFSEVKKINAKPSSIYILKK